MKAAMAENVKVFCSHSSADKPRVKAIDDKPVIPVMLDADAPVPDLLRSRARVVGEDLEQLIDAI